jgi:hypothetical protein
LRTLPLEHMNTSSLDLHNLISPLLKACRDLHGCATNALPMSENSKLPELLPKRLIDVCAFGSSSSDVKLIEDVEAGWDYAALSYSWGLHELAVEDISKWRLTTLSTLEANKDRLQLSVLPKTVSDAINITRDLGLRYLWADCVCIIQQSESDWNTEAPKMASIYQSAVITIACERGRHMDSGCFNDTDDYVLPDDLFGPELVLPSDPAYDGLAANSETCRRVVFRQNSLRTKRTSSEVQAMSKERNTFNSHLDKRAWCFQERLFSPRLLHFTSTSIIWECRERFVNLGLPQYYDTKGAESKLGLEGKNKEQLLQIWYELIREYHVKQVTFVKDRLPAISGLAKSIGSRLMETTNARYIAGMFFEIMCGKDDVLEGDWSYRRRPTASESQQSKFTETDNDASSSDKQVVDAKYWVMHDYQERMMKSLLWFVIHSRNDKGDSVSTTKQNTCISATVDGIPSFSWASRVNYDLGFFTHAHESPHYHRAHVIDYEILLKTGDPYGDISYASLTIRARYLNVSLDVSVNPNRGGEFSYSLYDKSTRDDIGYAYLDDPLDALQDSDVLFLEIVFEHTHMRLQGQLVPICLTSLGLLVIPAVSVSASDGIRYRRVGKATIQVASKAPPIGDDEKIFTLV